MKQLKIGIIGAGRIGSLHAKSITYNVPTATVVGITDVFKANGAYFMYHNHAFEFEVYDGKRTFERLIEETTADTLHFIPDTYWMQVGGVNPAEYLKKLKGRVEVCHFKDMRIVNNVQRFAECGTGNIDLGTCYCSCKEIGVKYIVIEQDICEIDPRESMAISYKNLVEIAKRNEK